MYIYIINRLMMIITSWSGKRSEFQKLNCYWKSILFHFVENGDRYEGSFMDGEKHGNGVLFYV